MLWTYFYFCNIRNDKAASECNSASDILYAIKLSIYNFFKPQRLFYSENPNIELFKKYSESFVFFNAVAAWYTDHFSNN